MLRLSGFVEFWCFRNANELTSFAQILLLVVWNFRGMKLEKRSRRIFFVRFFPFRLSLACLLRQKAIKFIAIVFEGESLKLETTSSFRSLGGLSAVWLMNFSSFHFQARRKWNTKRASGTRSVSAAASARRPSAQSRSSLASRTSTVPDATRTSSLLAAWSAEKWESLWEYWNHC